METLSFVIAFSYPDAEKALSEGADIALIEWEEPYGDTFSHTDDDDAERIEPQPWCHFVCKDVELLESLREVLSDSHRTSHDSGERPVLFADGSASTLLRHLKEKFYIEGKEMP